MEKDWLQLVPSVGQPRRAGRAAFRPGARAGHLRQRTAAVAQLVEGAAQVAAQGEQQPQLLAHPGQFFHQPGLYFRLVELVTVVEPQALGNFSQAETQALAQLDGPEPGQRVGGVGFVVVGGGRAAHGLEQAQPLVVADGVAREAGLADDFTDEHHGRRLKREVANLTAWTRLHGCARTQKKY